MKEKACQAREIITTIWVTANAKQRNTIPFCVVCVLCEHLFLFCSVWFRSLCQCSQTYKYSMVVYCTGMKINPNPARAEQNTRSVVDSVARLHGNVFLEGRACFLLFSLHLANARPGVAKTPTPTYSSFEAANLFLRT